MNKKVVNHRLFNEPVELTRAIVAFSNYQRDNSDYSLMMEAANHIRALEATVDFLHGEIIKREEIINKIPYGTYSWFHLAPKDDICVTRTVDLGDNNEFV